MIGCIYNSLVGAAYSDCLGGVGGLGGFPRRFFSGCSGGSPWKEFLRGGMK